MLYLVRQRGVFSKVILGSKTSDMTSEELWDMFEGDSADALDGKFPLVLMGGRAEGLACADPGARTPSAQRKFFKNFA